jgi:geranylgeranyl diphosphate synthase type II
LEDLFKELGGLKRAIDEAIEAAVDGYRCDVPLIREAMAYSTEGGKRLRGAIVLSTYKSLGGDGDAMPFALAIEMIQAYSLVHDDLPCMDDAEMRRGRPACHRKFGEAMGVLAGDALLTLAFETAASADLPPYRVVEGIKALAYGAGAAGMVGGQVLDLRPDAVRCGASGGETSANDRAGAADPSDSDSPGDLDRPGDPDGPGDLAGPENPAHRVRLMYRLKTGRLFETAAKLGAILAGAPAGTVERAAEAGMCFGLAYQILADIEDSAQGGAEDRKDTLPKRISLEKVREEAVMDLQRCKNLAGSGWLLERLADYYLATKLGVSPPDRS